MKQAFSKQLNHAISFILLAMTFTALNSGSPAYSDQGENIIATGQADQKAVIQPLIFPEPQEISLFQ